jgi:hypothetical protein
MDLVRILLRKASAPLMLLFSPNMDDGRECVLVIWRKWDVSLFLVETFHILAHIFAEHSKHVDIVNQVITNL